MKSDKIDLSLEQNESQAFVQNLDDSFEIAKTLVAFANTNGGKLVVGLKPNGKIVGIFPDSEIKKLKNITKKCLPEISYHIEVKEVNFRLILIVNIEKSLAPPHFLINEQNKKVTYIRADDQNVLANKICIQAWKYKDQNGELPNMFSPEESKIIEIIKSISGISLSQIYKKSDKGIDTIDYCLVRLINWNIIQMKITETGAYFSVL